MKTIILPIVLMFTGCRVTQEQKISGEAEARIVIEFPQAQACFDDERVETYDQLKECLELVTNNRWTVTVDGEVIPAIEDLLPDAEKDVEGEAVAQPENIEGAA